MKQNLLDYLEISDLPEDLKDIANECGLETVKLLLRVFPSTNIYIPNLKNLESPVKKYISERYKKKTPRELARDLSLSEPHIRKMIRSLKSDLSAGLAYEKRAAKFA